MSAALRFVRTKNTNKQAKRGMSYAHENLIVHHDDSKLNKLCAYKRGRTNKKQPSCKIIQNQVIDKFILTIDFQACGFFAIRCEPTMP